LNGLIFAIARLNSYSPPTFQEETDTADPLGKVRRGSPSTGR
jgi:hypothetical protein